MRRNATVIKVFFTPTTDALTGLESQRRPKTYNCHCSFAERYAGRYGESRSESSVHNKVQFLIQAIRGAVSGHLTAASLRRYRLPQGEIGTVAPQCCEDRRVGTKRMHSSSGGPKMSDSSLHLFRRLRFCIWCLLPVTASLPWRNSTSALARHQL